MDRPTRPAQLTYTLYEPFPILPRLHGCQWASRVALHPHSRALAGYSSIRDSPGNVVNAEPTDCKATEIGAMTTGTVKWFSDTKAFGYIKPDDSEEHLFFQYTTILATGSCTFTEGQRVEFEVTEGPKGLQAVNVRPIE